MELADELLNRRKPDCPLALADNLHLSPGQVTDDQDVDLPLDTAHSSRESSVCVTVALGSRLDTQLVTVDSKARQSVISSARGWLCNNMTLPIR
ncbi:hypothetical protein ACFYRN_41905 [Streptomyces sp. NPDC005227]|uniref:hypothetical protein n=1 Tax=Streptomyces sp. NPDC005227 TaxID=3364707 RepID=UPI0036961C8A